MAYLHDNWLLVNDKDIVTVMLLDNSISSARGYLGDKLYKLQRLKAFFEENLAHVADYHALNSILSEHCAKAEQLGVKDDLIDFLEINENDNVIFVYEGKIDVFHKECAVYRTYLQSIEKWVDSLIVEYKIDEIELLKRPSDWDDDDD